ncbi:MAG: type VI secretion system lipoprotein TssJ [Panacagrimonas sp.]
MRNEEDTRKFLTVSRWIGIVLCALVLAGCSAKKKPDEAPKPAVLEVELTSTADLNPDTSGRASPLIVRVYALRALGNFETADFFALYEKDEQVLAADLVKREEWGLKPGDTTRVKREFAPDVKFIAVMAAFRDVERATWRASVAVPPGAKGVLLLKADSKSVSLALEPDAKE